MRILKVNARQLRITGTKGLRGCESGILSGKPKHHLATCL